MAASPYLVQALQALSQPAQQAQPQGLSVQQMQNVHGQRMAWDEKNPNQTYPLFDLGRLGQGIAGVPGDLMQAGRNIASVPGQVGGGLQNLAQRLGFGQQTPPY